MPCAAPFLFAIPICRFASPYTHAPLLFAIPIHKFVSPYDRAPLSFAIPICRFASPYARAPFVRHVDIQVRFAVRPRFFRSPSRYTNSLLRTLALFSFVIPIYRFASPYTREPLSFAIPIHRFASPYTHAPLSFAIPIHRFASPYARDAFVRHPDT